MILIEKRASVACPLNTKNSSSIFSSMISFSASHRYNVQCSRMYRSNCNSKSMADPKRVAELADQMKNLTPAEKEAIRNEKLAELEDLKNFKNM